ncbi:MAG: hypothetical protein ACO2ZM_05050 [Francisellaceae bacterium]
MEQVNDIDGRLKLILSAQIDKLDELEKIWMHGYAHGQKDKEEADNPFPENTVEHNYWLEGFEAGEYDETPLFPEYISELAAMEDEEIQPEIIERKRFHLDKVDKLIASAGMGIATTSMVAAVLLSFMA